MSEETSTKQTVRKRWMLHPLACLPHHCLRFSNPAWETILEFHSTDPKGAKAEAPTI